MINFSPLKRVVTEALHHVGQSLQNSTVQAVLAPTCPTNVETNTSTRLPTPLLSVTNRSTSPRLPTGPMTIRPDSQRGGNGQLRLCNDGTSLTHSTPLLIWMKQWCQKQGDIAASLGRCSNSLYKFLSQLGRGRSEGSY